MMDELDNILSNIDLEEEKNEVKEEMEEGLDGASAAKRVKKEAAK